MPIITFSFLLTVVMEDTQDSTAELLRKARERRMKKAPPKNPADELLGTYQR